MDVVQPVHILADQGAVAHIGLGRERGQLDVQRQQQRHQPDDRAGPVDPVHQRLGLGDALL